MNFPGLGRRVNGTGHPCQTAVVRTLLDEPAQTPDAGCIADGGPIGFFIEP